MRFILTRAEPTTQVLATKTQNTKKAQYCFFVEGACQPFCLQVWHGHLARVPRGTPMPRGFPLPIAITNFIPIEVAALGCYVLP